MPGGRVLNGNHPCRRPWSMRRGGSFPYSRGGNCPCLYSRRENYYGSLCGSLSFPLRSSEGKERKFFVSYDR